MKAEELAVIKERADNATSGPWELSVIGVSAVGTPRKDVLWATINEDIYGNKADVDFVLNAREDVPKLVAEVERLRSVIWRISDYCDMSVEETRAYLDGDDDE